MTRKCVVPTESYNRRFILVSTERIWLDPSFRLVQKISTDKNVEAYVLQGSRKQVYRRKNRITQKIISTEGKIRSDKEYRTNRKWIVQKKLGKKETNLVAPVKVLVFGYGLSYILDRKDLMR